MDKQALGKLLVMFSFVLLIGAGIVFMIAVVNSSNYGTEPNETQTSVMSGGCCGFLFFFIVGGILMSIGKEKVEAPQQTIIYQQAPAPVPHTEPQYQQPPQPQEAPRPMHNACPGCYGTVEVDWKLCPHCGYQLAPDESWD